MSKKLRFSIRTKVLLLINILLLLIFGVLTIIFVQTTVRSLRQNLTNEAQSFAQLATEPIGKTFELYKDSGTILIDQQVERFTRLDPVITNVAVYDVDGKVVYKKNPQALSSITTDQATSFDKVFIRGSDGRLMAIIQPFIEDNGVHRFGVLYQISNSQIDQSIKEGILTILGLAISSLALTGLMLFLAMNQFLLKPIKRVSQTALIISAGQLDKNIAVERQDEIGDLAQSVNVMAESLKADIAKLKEVDKLKTEFMMIASHNLRTPLTVMNGYLETMKAFPLPDKAKAMLATVSANSARLGNLAEDILTIAELEAGHKLTEPTEIIELAPLVQEVATDAQKLALDKKLSFKYEAPALSIRLPAVRHHLKIAIWNLVDNAIKFTPAGGQVKLVVGLSADSAQITVIDSGIGINPAEQAKLFTKFHRGTSTLQYDYEGTGIGLYISRLLVRQFGGDISVSSTEGKGSSFTINLPIS